MINRIDMNNKKLAGSAMNVRRLVLGLGLVSFVQWAAAADRLLLNKVDFVNLPGDEIEIKLSFDQTPPQLQSYQIEKPARLVFDLPNTKNGLPTRYISIGNGNARSLTVVDNNDRTRMVINLGEIAGFASRTEGNNLFLKIGKNELSATASVVAPKTAATPPSSSAKTQQVTANNAVVGQSVVGVKSTLQIDNIDFRRGESGDGQIMIALSQPTIPVDVQQQGNKIVARFLGAKIPEKLRRRLDVADFSTPVKIVEAYNEGSNGVMVIQPQSDFEYLAYQADNKMTISVKPLTKDEKKKKDFVYTGEKLSLNFQDIEVRSVLQLIADFTSLNLVASDTVSGRITLRLQNVPWDQALDLILKTKGLDKRTVGNVMLVAPADEISTRERLELESQAQTEQLSPLRLEYIQVNYAKAADLQALISAGSSSASSNTGYLRDSARSLLSSRGSISVDARTNTLIVQETAKKLEEIRDLVAKLDVPIKQVMVESRIVLADTNFEKDIGVQWGVGSAHTNASGSGYIISGTRNGLGAIRNAGAVGGTVDTASPSFLGVDLGVNKIGSSSVALGIVSSDNKILDLALSALQSEGHGEIVATPRVLTADKKKARVSTGTNLPYQESAANGGVTTKYVNVELALEVTPSVTPDGRINMDLAIMNDSVGSLILANGARSVNLNHINTSVLVDDGQTVVLGGIFIEDLRTSTVKTPVLGDIPYIGRLFRQDIKASVKSELLIFVTPRLVTDVATGS